MRLVDSYSHLFDVAEFNEWISKYFWFISSNEFEVFSSVFFITEMNEIHDRHFFSCCNSCCHSFKMLVTVSNITDSQCIFQAHCQMQVQWFTLTRMDGMSRVNAQNDFKIIIKIIILITTIIRTRFARAPTNILISNKS